MRGVVQVLATALSTGMDAVISGVAGITEDAKFYINENNRPVIVFGKYEIAPGSSGEIEFEITGEN